MIRRHDMCRDLSGVGLAMPSGDGGGRRALARSWRRGPHLICHAAFLVERLGLAAGAPSAAVRAAREQRHFDVAELFAFVCPARIATPTPAGFARVVGAASPRQMT